MWGDLGLVLAGAGGTLGATTFVQLYIVPRAEMRKRREDRWERAVIALSEYLAFEYVDVQDQAMSALYRKSFVDNPPDEFNAARLRELEEMSSVEMREAFAALTRAQKRARVMLEQVTYLDRDRGRARSVEMNLMWTGFALDQHHYSTKPLPPAEEMFEISKEASERLKPVEAYLTACQREGRGARSVSLRRRFRMRRKALSAYAKKRRLRATESPLQEP